MNRPEQSLPFIIRRRCTRLARMAISAACSSGAWRDWKASKTLDKMPKTLDKMPLASRPNEWAARLPVERPSVPSHPHSGMGLKRLNYKRPTRQFDPDDKAALCNERERSPRSFYRPNHASAVCVVRANARISDAIACRTTLGRWCWKARLQKRAGQS